MIFIGMGIFFELCAAGIAYREMATGIAGNTLIYKIVEPYSPLIVPASVCLFTGFTLLDVKKNILITNLSALSFYIYLVHVGVWDAIQKVIKITSGGGGGVTVLNGAVWIPVFGVIVFVTSCLLSRLYLWLWAKMDAGRRITNWMMKAAGLNID